MIYRSCIFLTFLVLTCCGTPTQKRGLTEIPTPTGPGSHLPYLTSDSTGNIFLSWVEPLADSENHALHFSKLNGRKFSKPTSIAQSGNWFVNWADYPTIISNGGDVIAAHVLNKTPGNTYSYNVNMYLRDGADAWSGPVVPHADSTATEHGFASMIPWNEDVLAIWLDGRRTANRSEKEYFNIDKAMTLRSAVISRDGTVNHPKKIDQTVCDCCNTALAQTSNGAVAAYRNRTDDEIRDIYVSRYVNNEWTAPVPVHNDNWKIAACPVNGPAIAASDSLVTVAWYTAANGKRMIKATSSSDYGTTFSDPKIISDESPLGRVDLAMDLSGKAYISWMEKSNTEAALRIKTVDRKGNISEAQTITNLNASRKSGFPQMELSGGTLVFAWTSVGDTFSVQTATMPLDDID